MAIASWYRPHHTVLFCPPSPESKLCSLLQTVATKMKEECGLSVKVVERAGTKLQYALPGFKCEEVCKDKECFLHSSGGTGNHSQEGVVYKGECLTCAEVGPSSTPVEGQLPSIVEERKPMKSCYFGESSKPIYVRGKQHLEAIKKPSSHNTNAFAKHKMEYHLDEQAKFRLSIIKAFDKPLQRQILEGIEIRRGEQECDLLMNSKLDHFAPAVARISLTTAVAESSQQPSRKRKEIGRGGAGGKRGRR